MDIDVTSGSTNIVTINNDPTVQTVSSGSLGGATDLLVRIAATNILVGRLVAIVNEQAVHYDVRQASHTYRLAGIAVTNALAGTPVLIAEPGLITIPGWGLIANAAYRAGANGQLITGSPDSQAVFSQMVGKAITATEFMLTPQSIIVK